MIYITAEIVSDIIEVTATIPSLSVSGGACADATVRNSDSSYSTTVASGATLVLPDETINVYLDGVLNQTATYIPLDSTSINISL